MKYLKKFESNKVLYDDDSEVVKANQKIFTEIDIITDFMGNLLDRGIIVKSNIMGLNNGKGKTSHNIELDKDIEILKYINDNIDLKFPTFNYQISIFDMSGRLSNDDINEIKSELSVLKKRFDEMSNCFISNENFNINSKYSKSIIISRRSKNTEDFFTPVRKLKSNQKYEGEFLITESHELNFTIVYVNKKDDRY